ncbi:MAG: hypothetical protein ACAI43_22300 [Phycisphaerae bacterium]|nr:hypothetical protein [Tepidisphaeraceae bacterium]
MSTVYNPEADTIEQIERLELEARDLRRKIERAKHEQDRRALNKLLNDVCDEITHLQARLP